MTLHIIITLILWYILVIKFRKEYNLFIKFIIPLFILWLILPLFQGQWVPNGWFNLWQLVDFQTPLNPIIYTYVMWIIISFIILVISNIKQNKILLIIWTLWLGIVYWFIYYKISVLFWWNFENISNNLWNKFWWILDSSLINWILIDQLFKFMGLWFYIIVLLPIFVLSSSITNILNFDDTDLQLTFKEKVNNIKTLLKEKKLITPIIVWIFSLIVILLIIVNWINIWNNQSNSSSNYNQNNSWRNSSNY